MIRVPPELDSLMWAIAEENSAGAADEFVRRYPIYREELIRRQAAVSSLRAGKPTAGGTLAGGKVKTIPKFTPRNVRRLTPEPRQVAVASFLALAGLAAAAFTLTSLLSPRASPAPSRPPQPAVTSGGTAPQYIEPPKAAPTNPAPAPPDSVTNKDGTADAPPRLPKSDQPTSLIARTAPLKSTLLMLGLQSGLTIILAPGMPNPDVAAEYHDLTPMEILRDLGRRYRFTAFDQGDGTIVIYPAIDSGSERGAATPTRRIGG